MRLSGSLITMGFGGILLCGLACQTDSKSDDRYAQQVIRERIETVEATVESVDLQTRWLVLRRADGTQLGVLAGEAVRNLPQVRVGDKVKVNYYESVVAHLRRPDEPATDAEVIDAARAPKGERPGAYATRTQTVTATITAIDQTAATVTLRKSDGSTVTSKVPDSARLKKVRVGDDVVITYTEGAAIAVEPAN